MDENEKAKRQKEQRSNEAAQTIQFKLTKHTLNIVKGNKKAKKNCIEYQQGRINGEETHI